MTGSRTVASLLAAAGLLLPVASLRAQAPGSLDTTFNAGPLGATIFAVDYRTDDDGTVKITAGGDRAFGEYILEDGRGRNDFLFPVFGNIIRLIYTIVPERKPTEGNSLPNLLLGGQFGRGSSQAANGVAEQNIVRITPVGTLDTSFVSAIGTGANNFVTSILPLDDGRIVVGGLFTSFNRETSRKRIVRLQNNGSIDENFATGLNIDNDVLALAEGPIDPATGETDGTTLVGGIFNKVAGQPYSKLARLDSNGNLDMSFHPRIDLRVLAILVQPDGKIIIGGDFTNVNGVPVSRIARLFPDGSLDQTFVASVTGVPNNDVNPTAVYVLKAIPNDTRIYVGGEFSQINGATRRYLGLIDSEGALDTSFDPGTAIYYSVQSLAIQSDNNVIVGETLGPKIGKNFQPSLVRLIGVLPLVTGNPIPVDPPVVDPPVNTLQQAQPAVTRSSRASAESSLRGSAAGSARRYIW